MKKLVRRNGKARKSFSLDAPSYIDRALAFLLCVWAEAEGYGFIGTKKKLDGKWAEHFVDLRHGSCEIREVLKEHHREAFDLYFCPNTFSKRTRKKEHALPTRWGWCDIDGADPNEFRPRPSVLLRTSPKRFQGLWLWDEQVRPEKAERYSHALTYRFGGDPGGWSITKYLRLPYTYNHKPAYARPLVCIVRRDLAPISERPEVIRGVHLAGSTRPRIPQEIADPARHQLMDVYFKYRTKLHQKTKALMTCKSMLEGDRSKAIYMIVADLHSAGASADEISACLWVNPYFVDKYGQDLRALSIEINRIVGKLQASGK